MPLIALKAHYEGHAVIFDEPFDLPPETPLLVVVNLQGILGQPSDKANRTAAFQVAFGALRGKLSSSDEFMARKANVGFDFAQPTDFAQTPKSKRTAP